MADIFQNTAFTNKITNANQKLEFAQNKLRQKLSEKPDALRKLKELNNSPDLLDQFSTTDKADFYLIKKLVPDLFEEKKIPQEYTKDMVGAGAQPISESKLSPITGATPENIVNKTSKLKLTGLVEGYGNLMDKGYVPDIKNKNIWGAIGETAKYPLNRLLELLNTFPRAESAIAKQAYRKAIDSGEVPKIADFKLSEYDVGEQAKKNLNPLEALKTLNIGKEGWKQVAKETFDPLIKANSEYAGTGFTQLYEEMYPDTKFTKEFEYPKEWEQGSKLQKTLANVLPNESGNWWQRLISGFAGSPADIAGIASDVIFDPMTIFGGGLAKGAKTGANIADDLVKQGVKVLPKGAEIGLTKAGKTAYSAFKKSSGFDDIIKGLADDLITPSGVVKGLNATDTVAKQTAVNFLENKALNQFLQEVPDIASVNKYLDFGGLKIAGGTAIEGYKLAEKFGKLKNAPIISDVAKLFNENANVPDELVPFKNWLISAGENEKTAFTNAFYKIIKDGDKTDFDKVQKYLWLQSDIEQKAGKTKLIEKYAKEIDNLKMTDKQLKIADDLKVFWGDVAQQFKNATGKELNTYDFYTPIRYVKDEEDILKKANLLGPIEQSFEQSKKITMAQAEKLKLKPKDLITSSIQRLAEQEKNIFRSRLVNEVKQFGSRTADEGMVSISKIPELKGWYLPKEFEKVFDSTYRMFFADPSLNKLARIYDKGLGLWKRLALSTTGYDFRNFYTDNVSGLMEYGLKYYNPKYWYDAVSVMKGNKKKIMLNGKLRYADDLLKEMKQTGEITQTTMTAVEASYGKAGNVLNKARNVMDKISPIEAKFKYVSMPRENLGRVIAGLIERDSGANKIIAASNVKKVFFDYAHSLTPFERNVAKRIVPFYTWLKNNARRQVELLFTRTGDYAAIPKSINFMENISDKPEGYDEFQPDYQKDLGAFLTPLRQPGLPDWLANLLGREKTEKAGKPLSFNPNFAFQDWSRGNLKDLFSAASPFLKMPIELGFNREIYFGSDIPNYTKAPKIIELMFGKMSKEALEKIGIIKKDDGKMLISGKANYVLKQNPLFALAARSFPSTETDNTAYQNLSSMLGIKLMPYDEAQAKKQYYGEYSSEANKALEKYEGELPTVDQIKSAYKQAYYDSLDEKYKEALNAKKLFDVINIPREAKNELNKALEPYEAEKAKVKDMNLYELEELLMENGINLSLEDIEEIIRQKQSAQ
jgi:hypothetical protein